MTSTKIRDRVALGTLAGTIATIPQLILDGILVRAGLSKYFGFQISAGVYLLRPLTERFWGMLLGGLVWEFMAAGLGIITVCLIQCTGKEYWWLKGLLVSNTIMYIFIYGFFYALRGPRIVPWDLGTNWAVLIENLLFGVTVGFLVARWGDWSKQGRE